MTMTSPVKISEETLDRLAQYKDAIGADTYKEGDRAVAPGH